MSELEHQTSQVSETCEVSSTLPAGWRWVRLGDVCQIITGGTPPRAEKHHFTGNIPWIKPEHLDLDIVVHESTEYLTKEAADHVGLLPIGSVLVSCIGKIGKCAIAGVPLSTNQQINALIPSDQVDSMFLYWSCRNITPLLSQTSATALVAILNKSAFAKVEIPIPPLDEQRRIAAILREQMAAVDKARTAAQARVAAIRDLPAAYLRQVFPQPGQSLPEGWRWVKLGDIASRGIENGIFKRRSDFGHGVPIVNVSDLYRSMHLKLALTERVSVTDVERMQYGIEPGDMFFCRSSLKREGIGVCCIVEDVTEPAVFECHVMRVRLRATDAIPGFVGYYWQHPAVREMVIGNSRTATMTTMNQQDLGVVAIPLPPLPVQLRISVMMREQMAAVDKARAAAEAELEHINTLPAALLRRAFNGEL